jgi:hypothetical protein
MGRQNQMKNFYDLEQEIMKCWNIVEDIELLREYFSDNSDFEGMDPKQSDKIDNHMMGVKELYVLRFNRLFEMYERSCLEVHELKKQIRES